MKQYINNFCKGSALVAALATMTTACSDSLLEQDPLSFYEPTTTYSTEEGCLSLSGIRKTRRYQSIKVRYQNADFAVRLKTFTGWTAQIIQHEIDHCNGILI